MDQDQTTLPKTSLFDLLHTEENAPLSEQNDDNDNDTNIATTTTNTTNAITSHTHNGLHIGADSIFLEQLDLKIDSAVNNAVRDVLEWFVSRLQSPATGLTSTSTSLLTSTVIPPSTPTAQSSFSPTPLCHAGCSPISALCSTSISTSNEPLTPPVQSTPAKRASYQLHTFTICKKPKESTYSAILPFTTTTASPRPTVTFPSFGSVESAGSESFHIARNSQILCTISDYQNGAFVKFEISSSDIDEVQIPEKTSGFGFSISTIAQGAVTFKLQSLYRGLYKRTNAGTNKMHRIIAMVEQGNTVFRYSSDVFCFI